MIDISKLKYKLIIITEDGTQWDVSGAAEDLGWEEGENELALRLNFGLQNTQHRGKFLSDLVKPGCRAVVIADWGDDTAEVARGTIVDWEPSSDGSANRFNVLAYDELFFLQQSQDNRYFPSGTGTTAALGAISNALWTIQPA